MKGDRPAIVATFLFIRGPVVVTRAAKSKTKEVNASPQNKHIFCDTAEPRSTATISPSRVNRSEIVSSLAEGTQRVARCLAGLCVSGPLNELYLQDNAPWRAATQWLGVNGDYAGGAKSSKTRCTHWPYWVCHRKAHSVGWETYVTGLALCDRLLRLTRLEQFVICRSVLLYKIRNSTIPDNNNFSPAIAVFFFKESR